MWGRGKIWKDCMRNRKNLIAAHRHTNSSDTVPSSELHSESRLLHLLLHHLHLSLSPSGITQTEIPNCLYFYPQILSDLRVYCTNVYLY